MLIIIIINKTYTRFEEKDSSLVLVHVKRTSEVDKNMLELKSTQDDL